MPSVGKSKIEIEKKRAYFDHFAMHMHNGNDRNAVFAH